MAGKHKPLPPLIPLPRLLRDFDRTPLSVLQSLLTSVDEQLALLQRTRDAIFNLLAIKRAGVNITDGLAGGSAGESSSLATDLDRTKRPVTHQESRDLDRLEPLEQETSHQGRIPRGTAIRLSIFNLIRCRGPSSAAEIADWLSISAPAVRYHLTSSRNLFTITNPTAPHNDPRIWDLTEECRENHRENPANPSENPPPPPGRTDSPAAPHHTQAKPAIPTHQTREQDAR